MEYGIIIPFIITAILLGGTAFFVNHILMPKKPSKLKSSTYECGNMPIGEATLRYNIRFFTFTIMYVVFSIEALFLFPWAVVLKKIAGFLPLIEVLIFLFILILALAFAWNKGALKWD